MTKTERIINRYVNKCLKTNPTEAKSNLNFDNINEVVRVNEHVKETYSMCVKYRHVVFSGKLRSGYKKLIKHTDFIISCYKYIERQELKFFFNVDRIRGIEKLKKLFENKYGFGWDVVLDKPDPDFGNEAFGAFLKKSESDFYDEALDY